MKPKEIVVGSLFIAVFLCANIFLFGLVSTDSFAMYYFVFLLIFCFCVLLSIRSLFARSEFIPIVIVILLFSLSGTFLMNTLKKLDYSSNAELKGAITYNDVLKDYIEQQILQLKSYQNESRNMILAISSSNNNAITDRDAQITKLQQALDVSYKVISEYELALAKARAVPVVVQRVREDD